MGAAFFYQLTRSAPEALISTLVEKARAAGWRVCLRGADPARMERLDTALWMVPEDGFLPHGLAGGPQDAVQPVLLTTDPGPATNGAECLMVLDGAGIDAAEVVAAARVCVIFEAADEAALAAARVQWKALTAKGVTAQYWAEDAGRWAKKAESGPPA